MILAHHPSGLTLRPRPDRRLSAVEDAERLFAGFANGPPERVTVNIADGDPWSRPWWVDYVEAEFNALLALPQGWDGRRAGPVAIGAVETAIEVLAVLMNETSAPPQLFPLPDGGLELGWWVGGDEIEVEIAADGDVQMLAETAAGQTVAEGAVTLGRADASLEAVRTLLGDMSARLTRVPAGA